MAIKNSLIALLLLSFLPCLGFQPMVENSKHWQNSGSNLETKSVQELHDKYATMIDKAIAEKQDLNKLKTACSNPLLTDICMHGFNNLAKKMLNNGANIEIQDILNQSPLATAATYGCVETVKLLLDYGANIENSKGKCRPLIEAVSCESILIISLLLKRGALVNAQDQFEETALHKALSRHTIFECYFEIETRTAIIKLLIESGADLNIKSNFKKTPLDVAQQNFPELVPVMLKALEDREVR
jgi:ankyrin repeat protein